MLIVYGFKKLWDYRTFRPSLQMLHETILLFKLHLDFETLLLQLHSDYE